MTDPQTSGLAPGSPEWRDAWRRYWHDRVPYDRAAAELQQGDGASFGVVIRYLTERPRFHGSGYIAERMLRFLSRVDWRPAERERIVAAATAIAAEGRTREAAEAVRLLRRLGA